MSDSPERQATGSSGLQALVVLGAILAIGVLGWVFLIRDDDSGDETPTTARAGAGPVAATPADIAKLGRQIGIPAYWAGEQGQATLELTRTSEDRIFVRYLDEGAEIADPGDDFLTVATYPLDGAFELLEQAGDREGAIVEDGPEGSLVVSNDDSPTSVYMGFPGEDYQIEIYDPDPERALNLATSGQIEPAG